MIVIHNIIIIIIALDPDLSRSNGITNSIILCTDIMLTGNGLRIPDPTRPNHPNLRTIKNPRGGITTTILSRVKMRVR